ncbi:arginyltransferase [Tundrisphaera sp. TA3]|uniref:arginyltransferase n=1 Tax=Tundrisphaera sp. TA3 TaxID=3435775 RepID=UPI003EBB06D1
MKLWPPILDDPGRCGYLPDRDWTLEYQIALEIDAAEYASRMLAGWRRFGRSLFRPACEGCQECRPIRVDVARFAPDRSQRRARKANQGDVLLEIGEPSASRENLDLYRRYHAHQAGAKQWPDRRREGAAEYVESFVDNPFPTEEWRFRIDGRLVGVGYVDSLPVGLSAITFIYDPDCRSRSLGTWNVLALIDRARSLGLPHVYLGYLVEGCGSMAYKARFLPSEIRGADGIWREFRGIRSG